MQSKIEKGLSQAWADHGRQFEHYQWIYPVISRRARGISLGLNLNPDTNCNFDCAYCQVDRTHLPQQIPTFSLSAIRQELLDAIGHYRLNRFQDSPRFQNVPKDQLVIRDLCMSGDGEPTLIPQFADICAMLTEVQELLHDMNTKLVLITNATRLQHPEVARGLQQLTRQQGEIWGKLDAGTEAWFARMDRSRFHLDQIQDNLNFAAAHFPLRIQTMLCSLNGRAPDSRELEAYIQRIQQILASAQSAPDHAGVLEIQLYSIVRRTATSSASSVPRDYMEQWAEALRSQGIQIPIGIY